jgi:hypothetical protein
VKKQIQNNVSVERVKITKAVDALAAEMITRNFGYDQPAHVDQVFRSCFSLSFHRYEAKQETEQSV